MYNSGVPIIKLQFLRGPNMESYSRPFAPSFLLDEVVEGRYTLPVFTARVHGPCSPAVFTGREHGLNAHV